MKWKPICSCALVAFVPIVASPCEAIGANGLPVGVASETAIIVWDSKTREEHFIREAFFSTKARSIGFLVPTPSIPKLTEVKSDAFDVLRMKNKEELHPGSLGAKSMSKDDVVIRTEHLGGFEETVISLKDPQAAKKWLKDHHFPVSGQTEEWIAPYAKSNWVITAFRMDSPEGRARLKPVDLSFHTDQPFYPYREPASKADDNGRTLQVFFLSDVPVSGKMGDQPWVAKEEFSDELTDGEQLTLSRSLAGLSLDHAKCCTSFLDSSNPRIGTSDIIFSPAPKTNRIWVALAGIVVIVVIFVSSKRMSRKPGR